jgi:sugar O-acyltransferase (sialic acid O-acetyltransferase NeuD family)
VSGIRLYILGSSGHAREVAAYFHALDADRPIVFVEHEPHSPDCVSVAEYRTRIEEGGPGESILGSGRCDIRSRMIAEILPPFATFVHSTATVLGQVGAGCVVAPHAVLAPHAKLGSHVLVNYNATVGHDTVVGQLSVIGPTAAVGGSCRLEDRVYVGAGALIREHLVIHAGAIIGMGAVVTKDVPENAVVVGIPARPMARPEGKGGWL